tara:strand:+ start:239 stop:625 length:387 start_codon:yes stop_codon:yes gene_type:complete
MLDAELVTTLGWYFLGVFSYKIGSGIFLRSQALTVFNEAIHYSLTALKIANENILSAQEIKIQAMKDSGVEQELIDAAKVLDKEFVETWQVTSLYVLRKRTPPAFRYLASFKNWFQAMRHLDKRLKKK